MFGRFIYLVLFVVAVAGGMLAACDLGGDLGKLFDQAVKFGDAFIRHAVPVLAFAVLMKFTLKR